MRKVSGSSATFDPLYPNREKINSYDRNGNIKSLTHNGNTGIAAGDYTYVYEPNTNRLDKITQDGATVIDYGYNGSGQLFSQTEGSKTWTIRYDGYGHAAVVYNAATPVLSLRYDERGNMFLKVNYDASGIWAKRTYYVRDVSGNVLAIYEQTNPGTATLVEMPIYGAGRIGTYKPSGANGYFRYEMNDHLGNVRAVCAQPVSTIYPAVTFETDTEDDAQENFVNYSSIVNSNSNHTTGTGYNRVQTLNGGDVPQGRVGLAKTLEVSPGDEVSISAYATYRVFEDGNSTPLINGLATAFGVSAQSTGEQLTLYNSLSGFAASVVNGEHENDDDGAPKMFVTILLFDKNYNFVDAAWDQVSGDGEMPATGPATSFDHLSVNYQVKQPGYAYMFLSNEHPVNAEAYFDDVTVTHTESPIVAGSDYYPFGLSLDGTEITDEKYRYGYQGQYSEKDETTGWNQFELRMYDARFGRWLSPDPYGQYASPYVAMGNNPVSNVDPNGGLAEGPRVMGLLHVTTEMHLAAHVAAKGTVLLKAVTVTASGFGAYASSFAAKTASISSYALNRLANGAVNTGEDIRDGFIGATKLAASIDRGAFGFNLMWNGGYDEFAVKLGFTASLALTMGEMSTPNPMSIAVTPVGNVPITQPVVVPTTTVLDVHGQINAEQTQTNSKTLWKGKGKERIDVENPNPGQRQGQIHYQDNAGNKYIYDYYTGQFRGAPNSVNKLLKDPSIREAIKKGLKYLGLEGPVP